MNKKNLFLFVSFNFKNLPNNFFSFHGNSLYLLCSVHAFCGLWCIEKVFSFLSQDEVEKLKQEEEKKIATLKRDKKSKKILRTTDGNSFEEGDDNVDGTSSESDDNNDDDNDDNDDDIHTGDSRHSR